MPEGTGRVWAGVLGWSFPVGPLMPAVAILWVHADNMARHPASYVEAPPTISRALWDPAIADPFAWVMIASAVFLTLAIGQVVLALWRLVALTPGRAFNGLLLSVFTVCEAVAVAGMIVLSQYTGRTASHLHDTGSFMLFFGHAIGISLSGWLIRRMRAAGPDDAAAAVLDTVRRAPRHALLLALLSAAFGIVYFGGKALPEAYFFWQRLVLSVIEVIVILGFLAYLQSLLPMVRGCRGLVRQIQDRDFLNVRSQQE